MAGIEKVVHIIPLGHEFDRAVKPFEEVRVDRIYILTSFQNPKSNVKMKAEQQYFADKVIKYLENKAIEVVFVETDLFNIFSFIKEISRVISKEKNEGNRISVNMSAASRLTSVWATLVGMMQDVQVYYVQADAYSETEVEKKEHGLSICRGVDIMRLVNFHFYVPDPLGMKILLFLARKDRRVKTAELLSMLKSEDVKGFEEVFSEIRDKSKKRKIQSRQLMKLTRTILPKLEEGQFITMEKSGRNLLVSITDTGRYMAAASGELE